MFQELEWHEDRVSLKDLVILMDFHGDQEGIKGERSLLLYKAKDLYQQYESLFSFYPGFKPQNVLEIGIWNGGSMAIWNEILHPNKLVGIDLRQQPVGSTCLADYVQERRLEEKIKTYWGVNQADHGALKGICDSEFPDGIDLVVDDGSHFYEESKSSFEFLFPQMRQRGLYIIEDWAWSHWPEVNVNCYFGGKTPLDRIVFDITEWIGTARTSQAARLIVMSGFIVVEKLAHLDAAPFSLDNNITRPQPPVPPKKTPLIWLQEHARQFARNVAKL